MKWLVFILTAGLLLRLISLSNFPVGFNADEASNGYDAYSILNTGRDQWGIPMPLILKSFGDFKSPLYTYLTIPSIASLGLTKFAVRLPNAILGTLAVLITYLLIRELIKKYKEGLGITNIEIPALVGAALLAVNPWHIMMSRTGLEANLVTLFIPLGVYFFFKGLINSRFYIWSALSFGLSLFTYHSAKIVAPLIILGLIITFWKDLKEVGFKKLLAPALIMILFLGGLIYTFSLGGGARALERSITQGALLQGAEQKIKLINSGTNPMIARLLHNKYQVTVQRFVNNYSQYFSSRFLFVKGAGESSYGMIPGIPAIYLVDGLLLLGLIPIILKKNIRELTSILMFWLVISPLPAALSTGVGYSGNRAETMISIIPILAAFGFIGWGIILRKSGKNVALSITGIAILLVFLQTSVFIKSYFKYPGDATVNSMLYGSLEVAQWLKENSGDKRVIISRSLGEPQIFIAFAGKWDPADFQNETKNWGFTESGVPWVDQIPSYEVGKYTFKSLDLKVDTKVKNSLIVGRPEEFPKDVKALETIKYPDGSPAIIVVNTN